MVRSWLVLIRERLIAPAATPDAVILRAARVVERPVFPFVLKYPGNPLSLYCLAYNNRTLCGSLSVLLVYRSYPAPSTNRGCRTVDDWTDMNRTLTQPDWFRRNPELQLVRQTVFSVTTTPSVQPDQSTMEE